MVRAWLERNPTLEEQAELPDNAAPVSNGHSPLTADLLNGQIDGFTHSIVCWVDGLGFCIFVQHPMEPLHGVCCVDKHPHFLRVFETGAELRPVGFPRFQDLRVLFAPHFAKFV